MKQKTWNIDPDRIDVVPPPSFVDVAPVAPAGLALADPAPALVEPARDDALPALPVGLSSPDSATAPTSGRLTLPRGAKPARRYKLASAEAASAGRAADSQVEPSGAGAGSVTAAPSGAGAPTDVEPSDPAAPPAAELSDPAAPPIAELSAAAAPLGAELSDAEPSEYELRAREASVDRAWATVAGSPAASAQHDPPAAPAPYGSPAAGTLLIDPNVERDAPTPVSFEAAIAEPLADLAMLQANAISAWFGDRKVLDRVSLTMEAGKITALIGPSGCGKSTFLRIMNRMHEMIPSASLAGEVLLDGVDIYGANRRLTEARRDIGMVFQKPNPFPAMSIYDNVIAGLKLTGMKVSRDAKDQLVESSLTKAGLWKEVRDRLRQPGGGLSGGQQQRLCIARSLAVRPRVLLMDEPCSALDPTSTRVIEETMLELAKEVTIVIVTHNMQQAQRVSNNCAFFLAAQNTPGAIVEQGDTEVMFSNPTDSRTFDYVNGRFG